MKLDIMNGKAYLIYILIQPIKGQSKVGSRVGGSDSDSDFLSKKCAKRLLPRLRIVIVTLINLIKILRTLVSSNQVPTD